MKIQTITKYKFRQEEYNSLKEIQDKIHNIIGEEVLDKINKNCDIRHKDLFKMLDILCSPEVRKVLVEVLNVTVNEVNDEDDVTTKNILDYNFSKNSL